MSAKLTTKVSLKSATAAKKIESPLAKYNSSGQLFCVLCNVQVKNEMFWTGHINGKAHRDQLAALKAGKNASASAGAAPTRPTESPQKRPSSTVSKDPPKRAKLEEEEEDGLMGPPSMPAPRAILKKAPPPPKKKTFQEIEREEQEMEVEPRQRVTFRKDQVEEEEEEEEKEDAENASASTAAAPLPAGFFDDAKADAKARGLEYKNPDEEEWDRFVKEIATEEVKSSHLRVADEEDSAKDRELDEIEDQMKAWKRVVDLEKKAEQIRQFLQDRKRNGQDGKMEEEEEEDMDEDVEEDEMNWRSKKR